MLGMTPYNDVRFALLGGSIVDANALLRAYIWALHCDTADRRNLHGIALLARAQRRRHFRSRPGVLQSEIKEEKGPRPVILRPSGLQG